jgi:hypothetical protein
VSRGQQPVEPPVRFSAPDPSGADLDDAELAGAELAGAELAGAELAGAELAGASALLEEADDPPIGVDVDVLSRRVGG